MLQYSLYQLILLFLPGTVPSNWSDVALDTELPDGVITFTGDVTGSVTPSPNAQSRALTVADEVRLDTRIPAWTQGSYVSNQTVKNYSC